MLPLSANGRLDIFHFLLPAMFVARRLPRARALARFNSSLATQKPEHPLDTLRAVASLRREPTALAGLVTKAVADNDEKATWSHLVRELGNNPSLGDRWEHIDALLARPQARERQKVTSQRSHALAVEKINQAPQEELMFAVNDVLELRFPDAPFMSVEHALQLQAAVPNADDNPNGIFLRWLATLPPRLVRVSTKWERSLFKADTVRADAARQIRVLEDHIAKTTPKALDAVPVRRALMHAYGSTRVAADDAARHWDAIRAAYASGADRVHIRALETALAVPRTVDGVHAVWAQIQKLPVPPPSDTVNMPVPDAFYALNLVRVGALDEAEEIAKKWPLHSRIGWVVKSHSGKEKTEKGHATKRFDNILQVTRRNRERAEVLANNGLDQEDVLYMFSLHSPFANDLNLKRRPRQQ
ncbi:hypothetical protein EXIGLDRAFT_226837 [Exidia glandulosa HHB12029]|uniref:Uncharacterized protein n=1 Tax=Exidia glandulosa HHB12029 TaxID=1314781 RepID=A0A165E906_EXIGL|nr:hypothetical protein EXIGLDRAFT_226837 [Exidia glandulosa HHB12029]